MLKCAQPVAFVLVCQHKYHKQFFKRLHILNSRIKNEEAHGIKKKAQDPTEILVEFSTDSLD